MTSLDLTLVTAAALPEGDPETAWLARQARAAGLHTRIAVWSDPSVDWGASPLTVVRSAWDYHLHRDAFLAWADRAGGPTTLLNPPSLLRFSSHKGYLPTLAKAGIPVVPTCLLEAPDPGAVRATLADHGWEEGVLKPAVGLDGAGVVRVSVESVPEGERLGTWLLQPLVESIFTRGELSVVLFDHEASHAVLKRPAGLEIRVQERVGGSVVGVPVDREAERLAHRALEALPEVARHLPLAYARVDVLWWEGRPHVAELELVEPSFFLQNVPDRAKGFLEGMARRLAASGA